MDNEVRSKRAELRKFLLVECHMEGMAFIGVLDRADAYILAAHVDACQEFIYRHSLALPASSQPLSAKAHCGDGWYCKDALELMQLKDEI